MTTQTIILPLPSPKLSPNARIHWAQRSKLVKAARTTARLLAQAQGISKATPIRSYRLRFIWRDKRRHDRDNASASCKAYCDGIADATEQDDSDWLFYGVEFGEPDKRNPRLEVVVELLES
jgi:crossover junction endodeoxyribonuclease RusA